MADKPGVPEFWAGKPEELARKTAQVANQIQRGIGNNSRKITLRLNQTTTEVLVSYLKPGNIALISAQDAASALEVAAGTIFAVVTTGKVTINHASAASTREVGLAFFG